MKRREALIPECDVDGAAEVALEIGAKESSALFSGTAHFACFASEVHGVADDDGADAVIFVLLAFELKDDIKDCAGNLAGDTAGASGERLSREAQRIRDCQTEARRTDIYCENTHEKGLASSKCTPMRILMQATHNFLYLLRARFWAYEYGVAGAHYDHVVEAEHGGDAGAIVVNHTS